MTKGKSEFILLPASITGEMKPQDIPLASGVDLEAIKAGDEDPLEVVVEVPAGPSTRGWNYKPESLQAIVTHVNQDTLSGFLGHQKPEEVANTFEVPVTHWVGARMEGTKAYFRGVVDAAAKDLKRWIRAGRIKQVSIFGLPKLQTVAGETQVIDYKPLSIDWTPLDRSGMPTRIVALGEMDNAKGENEVMDWKELLAQLKVKLVSGEVALSDILTVLDANTNTKLELLDKVKQLFGVTEDGKLLESAKEAVDALKEHQQSELGQEVKDAVQQKVTGEMAQNLIVKMIIPKQGQTKETIAGEIDSLLADESIKAMLGQMTVGSPTFLGGSAKDNRQQPSSSFVQTDSIPI